MIARKQLIQNNSKLWKKNEGNSKIIFGETIWNFLQSNERWPRRYCLKILIKIIWDFFGGCQPMDFIYHRNTLDFIKWDERKIHWIIWCRIQLKCVSYLAKNNHSIVDATVEKSNKEEGDPRGENVKNIVSSRNHIPDDSMRFLDEHGERLNSSR